MNTGNPIRYVVNFGKGKTGLSSVGFVLKDFPRTTDTVTELMEGTGIYGVVIDGIITPSYILWDTGDTPILYGVEDINVPLCDTIFQSVNLGQSRSGLSNVGATIAGVRLVVPELTPGSGIYGGLFAPTRGFRGPIYFDSGEGSSIVYAVGTINLQYELFSTFKTSSYMAKKVNDAVGKLELQGVPESDEDGDTAHILVSDGGYLLLSTGGRVSTE